MIDSVLLVAFGGPTAPAEIRPFLENVARGRRIPRERLDVVAEHYQHMPGGRSPLTERTLAQARALERMLAGRGTPLPVSVGMRNWHPYLRETLADMAAKHARRTLAIIMSAFRTEASWERYMADVEAARTEVAGAPEVVFAPPWSTRPGFHEAVAARTRAALEQVPAHERDWTPLIFTAHSIPVTMADRSPYVAELTAAAQAVTERLAHRRYSIAYQSRSGDPRERWLEPDINDVLKTFADRHAVVVPIGFVVDHVEILYDLDVAARETADARGVRLHRAETVNDHPAFIATLAELVIEARG